MEPRVARWRQTRVVLSVEMIESGRAAMLRALADGGWRTDFEALRRVADPHAVDRSLALFVGERREITKDEENWGAA